LERGLQDGVVVKELSSNIEIEAPSERVWQTLADFEAYPQWNPFIQRIVGRPEMGTDLEVRIQPPGGRGMTFKPTVLTAEPNRELSWLGRFVVPGLFDGQHTLRLEPLGPGRTRFVQSERFSGVLVPLFGGTLAKTQRGFEEMNRALKARAEQK
jgi:hypothetical protein